MKKNFIFYIIILFIVPTWAQTVDPRVDSLLAKMTLEEKIGQLTLWAAQGDIVTGPAKGRVKPENIRKGECGNVLNAREIPYMRMLQDIAVKESRLGIPLTFALDVVHGYRTIFPINLGESCTWNIELIRRAAGVQAAEASASGLNMTYAPMLDIARDARWGRIAESNGEDPFLGSAIAAARVCGFQGESLSDTLTIASCIKHFVAYGATEDGRDYNTVAINERTLRDYYLPPFKAAVDAGAAALMPSFNEYDGVPLTGNQYLLKEVLRNEWGFKGVVLTDYHAAPEMILHGYSKDGAQAAEQSMQATVDMDMEGYVYLHHLASLVKEGRISMQQVDDAVRRVLELKFRLGLFDDPYRYLNETREKNCTLTDENKAVALQEAEESMVLLKNKDAALPIKQGERVALIGWLSNQPQQYTGCWGGCPPEGSIPSIRSVFEKADVLFAEGCLLTGDDCSGFREALKVAKKADKVILLMGEKKDMSGEAKSRSDIRIPGVQTELLAQLCQLGKPVIAVVFNGRPLDLSREAELADALLEAWHPGTMCAEALYNIIYGKVTPSGHLTTSFPRTVGQEPLYYYQKPTGRPAQNDEGKLNIGLSGSGISGYVATYIDCIPTPLFPFGYGLSYTSFDYSGLELSSDSMSADGKITANIRIRNTGDCYGQTVAQLYIRDMVGSVTRPLKLLKGFEKIGLEPGESRVVSFEITPELLSFWRQDMTFGTEPGEFRVYIGENADVWEYQSFTLYN